MIQNFFKTSLLASLFVGLSFPVAAGDDDQVVLTFQKGPGRAFLFEDNPVITFDRDSVVIKRTVEPDSLLYSFENLRTITFGHLKGDFTNDGILDIKDVNEIIKNKAAGQTSEDVNGDGKVDVADILYIIKELAE